MKNINLKKGDITSAPVDAIVNAANPIMLGGGGVDGAIHRVAGPCIINECRKVKATNGIRCPYGEARITPACDLPAKYVIHAVGPRYNIDPRPDTLLKSAYVNSLNLAISYGCKSIAFPAISYGAYGYPLIEAAMIAISACRESKYDSFEIFFYLFSKPTYDAWSKALIT